MDLIYLTIDSATGNVGIDISGTPDAPLHLGTTEFYAALFERTVAGGIGFRLKNDVGELHFGHGAVGGFFAGISGGEDNFFWSDSADFRVQAGMKIGFSAHATNPESAALDTYWYRNAAGIMQTPGALVIDDRIGLGGAPDATIKLRTVSTTFVAALYERSNAGGMGFQLKNGAGTLLNVGHGSAGGFFAGRGDITDNYFLVDSDEFRVQSGMKIGFSSHATDASAAVADAYLYRVSADVVGVHTSIQGGHKSTDGTAGATASVAVAKVGGGTRTLNFKDGLYINYADS